MKQAAINVITDLRIIVLCLTASQIIALAITMAHR